MTDFGAKTNQDFQRGPPSYEKKLGGIDEVYANLNFRLGEGFPALFCFLDKSRNSIVFDEQVLGVAIS